MLDTRNSLETLHHHCLRILVERKVFSNKVSTDEYVQVHDTTTIRDTSTVEVDSNV